MKTKSLILITAVSITLLGSCCKKTEQATVISENLKFAEGTVAYESTMLVSNFGSDQLNPLNTEGKGYIMQIKGDKTEMFIPTDGLLNGPKGMAVNDDYLYIADVGKVVVYNLKNKSSQVVEFPEGNLYVNDIAIKGKTAYISVTNTGNLFALDITTPTELSSEKLTLYTTIIGANGLLIDGNSMYIASYPPDGITTKDNVIYKIEDLTKPEPIKFIEREGQYDGLALKDTKLYFTNWVNGEFGYVDTNTKEVKTIELGGITFAGPADIALLNGEIYIPDLPNSRIVKVKV